MATISDLSYIKNVHIRYYVAACEKLGVKYRLELKGRVLYVHTQNGQEVMIYKAATPLNAASCANLSKDKHALLETIAAQGVPVPKQALIRNTQKLEEFFQEVQKIVVKPLDGDGGRGITILPEFGELNTAFERAKKVSAKVIAESYVAGQNYRFIVLDGEILAIALRLPPLVHGDGSTPLKTLIEDYNLENKALKIPQVKINELTLSILKKQGVSLEDVIPSGKEVYLRLTANLSRGGTVRDITSECHDKYKEIARQAAKATGLRLVGVDMIAEDAIRDNGTAYVIETNAAPGLRIHYKDPVGARLDVAVPIISKIMQL